MRRNPPIRAPVPPNRAPAMDIEPVLAPATPTVYVLERSENDEKNTMRPRVNAVPPLKTPADDGIEVSPGDDTTPPNSLPEGGYNGIVSHVVTNVGFSSAAAKTSFQPSKIGYVIDVLKEGVKSFGLGVELTLEFENPYPEQSMVVWLKRVKQSLCDNASLEGTSLDLVETRFEDWANNRWVDISTDIRYAEQAEAIVKTVIESGSGQSAGRVKLSEESEDAKLGPVGARGRIILTYRARTLFSYAEMSMNPNRVEERHLVPLAVFLPHTSLCEDSATAVSVELHTPEHARVLDPDTSAAFDDLVTRAPFSSTAAILVPHRLAQQQGEASFKWHWSCLPPQSWCVLFWLSLGVGEEVPGEAAMEIGEAPVVDGSVPVVTLYQPRGLDSTLLEVGVPGCNHGPPSQLVRAVIQANCDRPVGLARCHTHFTISDASGSTRMRPVHGEGNVRSFFNTLSEVRFLKRLEMIPLLARRGLVDPTDIWADLVYIFNHTTSQQFQFVAPVSELLDANTNSMLLQAAATRDPAHVLNVQKLLPASAQPILNSLTAFLDGLRGVRPGGATNFGAAPQTAVQDYGRFQQQVRALVPANTRVVFSTFVNFDTDGGHNGRDCWGILRHMVDNCMVVGGLVSGFGAWVNQQCATRVAQTLGGPCLLTSEVPQRGSEGEHQLLRLDTECWMKSLRSTPAEVRVSAGSVLRQGRKGMRQENAVDTLAVEPVDKSLPTQVSFGAPDISALDHTGSVIEGVKAGQQLMTYLLVRPDADQKQGQHEFQVEDLASRLSVRVNGVAARVQVQPEPLSGVYLGHHWLQLLARPASHQASVLCRRLRERLEDDLSFAFNLPTASGSTAYLGRAKTEDRPPVSPAQQPTEPEIKLAARVAPAAVRRSPQISRSRGGANEEKSFAGSPRSMPAVSSASSSSVAAMSLSMAPQADSGRALHRSMPVAAAALAPALAPAAPSAASARMEMPRSRGAQPEREQRREEHDKRAKKKKGMAQSQSQPRLPAPQDESLASEEATPGHMAPSELLQRSSYLFTTSSPQPLPPDQAIERLRGLCRTLGQPDQASPTPQAAPGAPLSNMPNQRKVVILQQFMRMAELWRLVVDSVLTRHNESCESMVAMMAASLTPGAV
eukprot:TRINITY_DN1261_c0_g1_i2.p1 TRINITY_DN1261_c0_g1~~TRINITY_DN1261_c0_g1_i2.p1  ORF type:complete len:1126 (-),score=364.41 TRINITY_DN1261_c0_g1_i2:334-3711(-)